MLAKLSFEGRGGARPVKRLGPSQHLEAGNAAATTWVLNAGMCGAGAGVWEGPSTVAPMEQETPGRVSSRRVVSRAGVLFSAIRNLCGSFRLLMTWSCCKLVRSPLLLGRCDAIR